MTGKEEAGGGKAEALKEVEGMRRAPKSEAALEELVGASRGARVAGERVGVGAGEEKTFGVWLCK